MQNYITTTAFTFVHGNRVKLFFSRKNEYRANTNVSGIVFTVLQQMLA